MNTIHEEKKVARTWPSILALLVMLFFVVLVWFAVDTVTLYRTGKLKPDRSLLHRGRLEQMSTSEIQPWMNFSYINRVYQLPSDYLQNALRITDSRYPKVQVKTVAKERGISESEMIGQVQVLIHNYSAIISAP